jgi:hypothetical protein|tara:strand:- start:64 stop:336 length:273 start_codon:yes stop_codon:yes gene_type:complete
LERPRIVALHGWPRGLAVAAASGDLVAERRDLSQYLESVERADDGEHDGGHVVEAPPILAVRPNEEDEDADAKKETLGGARKRRGSTASS